MDWTVEESRSKLKAGKTKKSLIGSSNPPLPPESVDASRYSSEVVDHLTSAPSAWLVEVM